MKTWLIRGAKVVDPSQNLEDTRDILIKDGKIQEIGTNIISENAEIIEANGLIAAPGLVDMHVQDRKSTRLNSSHPNPSRMPSSA